MSTQETTDLQRLALSVPLERSLAELTTVITRVKAGLDDEVLSVVSRPVQVTSDAACERLTHEVREARDVVDRIADRHAAIKKFAYQLHRVIAGQEKELTEQVERWIAQGSRSIAAWIQQQKAARAKEQEEAQRKLDAEHARETERQAKRLEKQGEPALASQVREQAPYQRPVAYVPPVSVPAGTSVKEVWGFEIVDPNAVPRQYCKPDEAKIKAQVKLLGKDAVNSIAGVRVFPLDPAAQVRR